MASTETAAGINAALFAFTSNSILGRTVDGLQNTYVLLS